jgi:hypothetical protein
MGFHSKLRGLDLHGPTNEMVENQTGSPINKLKAISLDGMGTTHPKVILADPNVRSNFGIAVDQIANNAFGFVCTFGFLFAVDTSLWPVNTLLYSDALGNLSVVPLGSPIASVVAQDGSCGVLYVLAVGDLLVDNIPDWHIVGNLGTDEDVNFIGTQDAQGFQIKTNNAKRIFVDSQGRTAFGDLKPDGFIHIKEHTTSPGSGHIIHTFEVSTSSATYQPAFAYTVPNGSVIQIKVNLLGRESSTSRCSFVRTNTYTRDGGSAIKVGIGQSDYTYRSHDGYTMRFGQVTNQATIEVKADTANPTKWIGTVEIDVLTT